VQKKLQFEKISKQGRQQIAEALKRLSVWAL
jgi:hypothetical protein